MTLLGVSATGPDLLRLIAVPVFAWVAIRDIKTRRVSSIVWVPLSLLGTLLLIWDGWLAWNADQYAWTYGFLLPTTISLGLVVPIAYLFGRIGSFGWADTSALLVIAVFFPTFPEYTMGTWTFPLNTPLIGAFSFTILTNAVLIGVAIPVILLIYNGAIGRITPVMFLGWPISWKKIPETNGMLLESPAGFTVSVGFSGGGLDLDALRMYLRWRGISLADLRDEPDRYRDPATLPADPNPPTDGAVTAEVQAHREDEKSESTTRKAIPKVGRSATQFDDPWGAKAFLDDIERSAYGTTPEKLRDGLDVLVTKEKVWFTPGTPFLVPVFVGILVALVYGDFLLANLF
ncbi:A24 family peptidase C-terminal domain-containing protein [Natrinema caseinilyticum]|uniref:A24 family peptidase C-terminal domain-containing protein n=1 Tax=Natrinema caseinilyticum TaxID=2961570 RepID=UPI0020C356FA|nr:A24 family peptidase C-terminal domain-containing protein [Natrinema caseinilyticum]